MRGGGLGKGRSMLRGGYLIFEGLSNGACHVAGGDRKMKHEEHEGSPLGVTELMLEIIRSRVEFTDGIRGHQHC